MRCRRAAAWLALLGLVAGSAGAADYSFDAAEIEKKSFEAGGSAEFKQEALRLRPSSPLYPINFGDAVPRSALDRSTGTLELAARWNPGALTADARVRTTAMRDAIVSADDHRVLEAGLRWALDTHWSLDAGKRVMRWGKGYAFSPVGFVERPKDANDPQLAREGYTLLGAEWVRSFEGADAPRGGSLAALSVTALLLPTYDELNPDYGAAGHGNAAIKLSALLADTDIDLLWAAAGSRPARLGLDFSRNLGTQLELHGEWARIYKATRPLLQTGGAIVPQTKDATSWLIGARYITEREVTWIAEIYRNGSGYAADEYRAFVQAAQGASAARIAALGATPYARANPGRDYAYLRVSGKEPFDWLYVTPALTAIVNLRDHSFSLTPELSYTGIDNLELRARWIVLHGGDSSEFGARPIRSRLEAYARWSF